jgi:hypothetical protein
VRLAVAGCVALCAAAVGLAAVGSDRAQRPPAGQSAAPARAAFAVHHPRRYALPRGAVRVHSSHGLRRALAIRRPTSIVLAGGSYTGDEPFLNGSGHRIYAARRGRAVLQAGVSIGSGSGALVRGVVMDIRNPNATTDGAAIAVWGSARNARVIDTTIRGHGLLSSGVTVRRPEGLVMRRLVARGFTSYGVFVDANELNSGVMRPRALLEDLDVASVSRPVPRSANGRAEECVWIGNTALVRRVRIRSCAWAGLWTGTSTIGATFDQIDVDETKTGVYVEHFTRDSTFRHLRIGRRVQIGLNAEWDDPSWGGRPASVDNVIEHSRFASSLVGVYLDEGTTRTTVRHSSFAGQAWAAIGDYRGNGNAAYANDYHGEVGVRHEHLSSFRRP